MEKASRQRVIEEREGGRGRVVASYGLTASRANLSQNVSTERAQPPPTLSPRRDWPGRPELRNLSTTARVESRSSEWAALLPCPKQDA